MPKIVAAPKAEEEKRPIITICPNCKYTISYTEDEVERVSNNAMGVYCLSAVVILKRSISSLLLSLIHSIILVLTTMLFA